MKLDFYIDNLISDNLLKANAERDANHTPSGKVSASILGWAEQWVMLKLMGVKGEEFDALTLRKFKRGRQVEDWLRSEIKDTIVEEERFVEYQNCVGYVDAIVNTENWNFPSGIIPLEIKSVGLSKFFRIKKAGAQYSHKLQATLYGLAEGTDEYAIAYVDTDNLMTQVYVYPTSEYKDVIEAKLERLQGYVDRKEVPVFKAEEAWQSNPKYNSYSDWMELSADEIKIKLESYEPKT